LDNKQAEEFKTENKTAKLRLELDLKTYTVEDMVQILRKKLSKSKCNPRDIIKKYGLNEKDKNEDNDADEEEKKSERNTSFDKDRSKDYINFDMFKKIILEDFAFDGLSKEFLDQVFRALDCQAREAISY
jgi:hypothetical protein